MRLTRRNLLRSTAMAGAAARIAGHRSRAEGKSIFDMLDRNRVLRETRSRTAIRRRAQALIDTTEPILSFDTAYNLQLAISQYEQFVAAGGWDDVPQETFGLMLGNSKTVGAGAEAPALDVVGRSWRRRTTSTNMFDDEVDRGVRTFQARHGLIVNGKVDEADLLRAGGSRGRLRLDQLHLNVMRVSTSAGNLSDRYWWSTFPPPPSRRSRARRSCSATPPWSARSTAPTPILSSQGPPDQVQPLLDGAQEHHREGPDRYMKEDPEYLTKFSIHIYDGNGTEISPATINWTNRTDAVKYTFRQDPGAENSMGHCKIDFYNPYDVYLHDTPQKALFGENARFHSSGCVRCRGHRHRSRLAAARQWRLGPADGRRRRSTTNERRRAAEGPGADPHHLHHCLGQPAGHRQLPRRRLRVRRAGQGHLRQLTARWQNSRGGKATGSSLRVHPVGRQMRVAAIDAETGIEVVVIAPLTATQIQMQNWRWPSCKRRMAQPIGLIGLEVAERRSPS